MVAIVVTGRVRPLECRNTPGWLGAEDQTTARDRRRLVFVEAGAFGESLRARFGYGTRVFERL